MVVILEEVMAVMAGMVVVAMAGMKALIIKPMMVRQEEQVTEEDQTTED